MQFLEHIRSVSKLALESGALQPIATRSIRAGRFFVRLLLVEDRKEKAQQDRPSGWNPFLPYEDELFVEAISVTHVCLLNKFQVSADHILLVTRDFHEQNETLSTADFEAVWTVFSRLGPNRSLMFYNSAPAAGASQRHKHLQVVPTPLAPGMPDSTVFEPEVLQACGRAPESMIHRVPELPFAHAVKSHRHPETADEIVSAAKESARTFQEMVTSLSQSIPSVTHGSSFEASTQGYGLENEHPGPLMSMALNVLMTSSWMMVIPRKQEKCGDISVNALGFAGSLFVKSQRQLEQVLEDPMEILCQTGYRSHPSR
mmetsp:Transcript_5270/g.10790  ORF Transcript_5270/g.10790 Transcript_5270/m.10790 type:complete len:315 (+) Transcript_5270:1891-2835(+)